MEKLLRRHGWFVDLVVIGLCAILLGHAAALGFEPVDAFAAAAPARRRAAPAARAPTDVATIVERNLFCSACRSRPPAQRPARAPEQTPLPLAILAIMYAPPPRDPGSSLAVVRDTEDLSIHALAAGDQIRGATVAEIGPTRILLRQGEETQYLDLLASREAQQPVPAPVTTRADPLAAELARGVRKLGEGSYEVDRTTLNAVLANTSALVSGARILPELRDGRSAGFRLSGVRPDGPFARIGLRNGDLLSAINGLPLTAAESALEAFVKLRSASHLSLALERDGRKVTYEYNIR